MITGHTTAPTHQQGSRISRSHDELDHTAQYTKDAANATTQPSFSRPKSAPNRPQLPNPPQRPLSPLQHHQQASVTTRSTQQAIPNSVAAPHSPSSPNHRDPSSPTALTNGYSGDYTQRIRYPNNSGILVQPLENEDLFFLEQEGITDSTPKFFDHTPLMPAQMSPSNSSSVNGAAKGLEKLLYGSIINIIVILMSPVIPISYICLCTIIIPHLLIFILIFLSHHYTVIIDKLCMCLVILPGWVITFNALSHFRFCIWLHCKWAKVSCVPESISYSRRAWIPVPRSWLFHVNYIF